MNTAQPRAISRLIFILQQAFAAEVAAIASPLPVALLPVPAAADYYILQDQTWLDDAEPVNATIAAFVYPITPVEIIEDISGDVLQRTAIAKTAYVIAVQFSIEQYEPFTHNGKTLTTNEVMVLRAQRYAGAISHVLNKHAISTVGVSPDADAILDVDVLSMDSTIVPTPDDERGIVGVAMVEAMITQHLQVPQQTYIL